MPFRRAIHVLAGCCAFAAPCAAAAQTPPADSGSARTLFEKQDLYWAGGFVAATVVLAPLDRALARAIQDSSVQAVRTLNIGATGVRLLGSPGGLIMGSTVYLGGRLSGHRDVASLGLHTTESVLLAGSITGIIKMAAGRQRPRVDVETPYNFRFLGGFKGDDFRSFPSGHTTSAFAAAAAASEEVGQLWPERKLLVSVILYGTAGLTGISRVYNNAHWASDVAVGAGIGAFTGWKVVRYSYDHPGNTMDRIFLGRRPAGTGTSNAARSPIFSAPSDGWVPDHATGVPITFTIHTR